jgi:predicted phage baseplate assembly protein
MASRRLEFAELPIETPLERVTQIELDRLVLQLAAGQPVAVLGERSDTPGVDAAEVATLADVIHAGGRTTLVFTKALEYSYTRRTVTIAANVIHATHGETVTEMLGSGNGSVPNQRFPLKKPPLTYLSAPTSRGVASTLELRVNRVEWEEISSLYLAGPAAEAYTVRIDDDAHAEVIFGDGERGARVPTGNANVTATYRSGIGVDGEVDASTLTLLRTIPLGIRGVTNPVAAAGAESPETLSNARRNAPLTVLTFERIVSLDDFEDFARTFPGIGKARADRLWVDGRDVVRVTVAGATQGAPGDDVLQNLIDAVAASSDGSQTFDVGVFAQRFFTVHARVVIDPRRVFAEVQAEVAARLQDAFSFDQREFAQSVTPSEVLARMHEVDGVVGVDLESLAEYVDGAPPPASVPGQPVEPIVARRAQWNAATRAVTAADLLLVNPVGITIEERQP